MKDDTIYKQFNAGLISVNQVRELYGFPLADKDYFNIMTNKRGLKVCVADFLLHIGAAITYLDVIQIIDNYHPTLNETPLVDGDQEIWLHPGDVLHVGNLHHTLRFQGE